MNVQSSSSEKIFSAIVGMKSFSNDGVSLSRKVLSELKQSIEILAISSIYKVKRSELHPLHIHDIRKIMDFEGLSLAVKCTTSLDPWALISVLEGEEKKHRNNQLHRNLSLNLLVYENQTLMTQKLTLPHSDLHMKPELLFPAAEVWADYEHPVKKKTLESLTRDFANLRWGEFFEQGKTLLDF